MAVEEKWQQFKDELTNCFDPDLEAVEKNRLVAESIKSILGLQKEDGDRYSAELKQIIALLREVRYMEEKADHADQIKKIKYKINQIKEF